MNTIRVSALVSCYKGEKYLSAFLQNAAEQTMRDTLEIVLVHNQPSEQEKTIVRQFQEKYPGLVNHIVVSREPLAVSTNRAIQAAAGDYVCVWNVDDLRTPNSLELMAQTLDKNPQVAFTYGDYIVVKQWLSTKGRQVNNPEFEKKEFVESMHTGPFYMWRKSLCQKIGYWDEQCLQGADYDYSCRLACESEGKKTPGQLGYYLDEGLGLSTRRGSLQPIERTFIELRFGIYSKLDFWYYTMAKKYDVERVLQNGIWVPVDVLAPHRKHYTQSRLWLVYAVGRYPFWILLRAYHYLKKLGS